MSGAAGRYLSLDVLRGLTVALMIVVNTPGDWGHVFAPLLHADWHGFTPTDWVFPTFLFVVGNALAFAMPRHAAQGSSAVVAKVLRRAALIFLLGFLLYWFPFFGPDGAGGFRLLPFADTRIPGVLQRIGLCFGIAALILHFARERGALAFSVWPCWDTGRCSHCTATTACKVMPQRSSTSGCWGNGTCITARDCPSIQRACWAPCPQR
jgi:predicted acyltransferase